VHTHTFRHTHTRRTHEHVHAYTRTHGNTYAHTHFLTHANTHMYTRPHTRTPLAFALAHAYAQTTTTHTFKAHASYAHVEATEFRASNSLHTCTPIYYTHTRRAVIPTHTYKLYEAFDTMLTIYMFKYVYICSRDVPRHHRQPRRNVYKYEYTYTHVSIYI